MALSATRSTALCPSPRQLCKYGRPYAARCIVFPEAGPTPSQPFTLPRVEIINQFVFSTINDMETARNLRAVSPSVDAGGSVFPAIAPKAPPLGPRNRGPHPNPSDINGSRRFFHRTTNLLIL